MGFWDPRRGSTGTALQRADLLSGAGNVIHVDPVQIVQSSSSTKKTATMTTDKAGYLTNEQSNSKTNNRT